MGEMSLWFIASDLRRWPLDAVEFPSVFPGHEQTPSPGALQRKTQEVNTLQNTDNKTAWHGTTVNSQMFCVKVTACTSLPVHSSGRFQYKLIPLYTFSNACWFVRDWFIYLSVCWMMVLSPPTVLALHFQDLLRFFRTFSESFMLSFPVFTIS